MSLHSMLEFDCTRPTADDVVEMCLFADCFNEMLQRDFGLQVIEILKKKKAEAEEKEEKDRKRKREEEEAAAEKKAKLENGEAKEDAEKSEEKTEEKKEEKKPEPAKPKFRLQHTVNQELLVPFQFFDKQPHTGIISGSLRRDVLEGLLHQYDDLTKRDIDDLLLKGANLKPNTGAYNSPPSILYYIKIATTTTEIPIEEKPAETAAPKEEAADKADATTAEEAAVPAAEESKAEDAAMEDAEEGDADKGEMTEASLNKLLLKDLRTMCQEKGLSTTGKKSDLIERLLKGE